MRSMIAGAGALMVWMAGPVAGQESEAHPAGPTSAPASRPAETGTDRKAGPTRAELEAQLAETLTDAVLTGTWQLIEGDGLGKPKTDKYTILKAQKFVGDFWLITVRIEYGDKDVTVPLPLRIVWAGDTPVITLSDLNVPGIGTYSARVMIHRNLYSGTWFGVGYGGVLSGTITKREQAAPAEKSRSNE